MHGVFILHTIISSVARNGNTGRTFSQRTLYTIQRISIPPHCHFERSEKSFSSPFSTTPSLSRLREAPSPPFLRYSVSHFSLSGTLPLTANEKDPSTSLGMTLRKRRFPNISFIRDVGYLFPTLPSFRAQREIFLALCSFLLLSQKGSPFPRFLVPFAEAFPFSAITHTTLYRCARKIEGFARDDVAEVAFSQHTLYTGRGLSIPPYRHFERSREIFFALCSFLLPSQKVSPFPRFLVPFAEAFPFSAITHTALYWCARKIPRLRSG